MVNPKHLKKLREGVLAWDIWREDNPDIVPDLIGANLTRAKLYYVNFKNANLKNANLENADIEGADIIGANLENANLQGADLIDANLSDTSLINVSFDSVNLYNANLSNAKLNNANLSLAQALNTDFSGANLTGACIEDWNINSKTNLENVQCDYIYLKYIYSKEERKYIYSDRRPHDPDKIFAPGEFTKLFQKALKTVDLIFSEGIEWAAFLESFQQLKSEIKSEDLSIQAIERKAGGAFVVRLEVPGVANKAEIQKLLNQLEKDNPTETFAQKGAVADVVIGEIVNNLNQWQKVIDVIKAMGIEALAEAVDNPIFNIAKAGVEAALE